MIKICEVCGQTFDAHSPAKTCSPKCNRQRKRDWKRHYYQDHCAEMRAYQRNYYARHIRPFKEIGQ